MCALLDRAAQLWPLRASLEFQAQTFTWQDTAQRSRALALALQEHGVKKGDRIAFLGLNSHRYVECYFAPAYIGAIFVPLNYRCSVRELIEYVQDISPRVLFVDAEFAEVAREIQQACDSVELLVCSDNNEVAKQGGDDALPVNQSNDLPCYLPSYDELIDPIISKHGNGLSALMSPGGAEDTMIIFSTGGTTGRAKGVMLSHANFFCNTRSSIALYDFNDGESMLTAGPLFHLAAGSRIFSLVAVGGFTTILAKFETVAVLQAIAKESISFFSLVPTMLQMMLDHPEFDDFDLSSLRMITYGAAPMPESLIKRALEEFPFVGFMQGFGMTETSPIVSCLDAKYHVLEGANAGKLKSIGKPIEGIETCIIDEQDNEVAANIVGELCVRGDNVMQGYWQQEELSKKVLRDGWYHTGDGAYVDEQGFLFLAGRIKDMIVSGGENVYPIEVENILGDHDAVNQCAVIGIPHEQWGEAVHGVISVKPGVIVEEKELIDYCRDRLAHYKCPVSVTIQTAPLPLSSVNKILKSKLREPFWQGRDSDII